ncbi:uncharacterized protein LOC107693005 [Sinocyclocheilus anshuiensis]|uniref:uncharacterized protein LOC107693005 n=1 Tax=Sinocyclocheilus anshuiensis TaxID=1608454 RepID=UPI0007B8EC9E|nr:PREDICTED: uncharacterized protein LOC107693005 [Sinocyclocheilus anshuiensis]
MPQMEESLVGYLAASKASLRKAAEIEELRRSSDLALRATKQAACAIGRSLAALIVTEKHLWLNLSGLKEKERTFLLDAPVSKVKSAAFERYIPRRRRRSSGQPPEPELAAGPSWWQGQKASVAARALPPRSRGAGQRPRSRQRQDHREVIEAKEGEEAVTSSTGCAGSNAVGKGAGIRFNSLEHEALLEAQNVVVSVAASKLETQDLVSVIASSLTGPRLRTQGTQNSCFCCCLPCNRPETQYRGLSVSVSPLQAEDSDQGVSFGKDKNYELIKKSTLIEDRKPARYHLTLITHDLDQSKPYRKMTFGERDSKKNHKTLLMVGETGTGKTTLINAIVNYMLGVKREDKVWFEITDDQGNWKDHSSTAIITVYGVYDQKIPDDLTIIDTPGYGNTHGITFDKEIAMNLLRLYEDGLHEIDAVCLVIDASQTRLSDRQIYIFDAVQSLFGRDIAENIVLLFTHSTGAPPKNVLMTIKEAKVKCAVNDKMKPVYFLFDNCQSMPFDEKYETIQEQSWKLSHFGIMSFFKFLENIKPKQLKMTRDVLQKRKHLEANVSQMEQENLSESEKITRVNEAFHCLETLEMIALNTDSLLTLLHIDSLIENLKEMNQPEKVKTLEDIKKRAGEENTGALGYIKRFLK